MTIKPLYLLNDTIIELGEPDRLTNGVTGAIVPDANALLTIVDAVDGTEILPATSMFAVGGSAGLYRAVVDEGIGAEDGKLYEARIEVTAPGGVDGHFVQLLTAQRRLQ